MTSQGIKIKNARAKIIFMIEISMEECLLLCLFKKESRKKKLKLGDGFSGKRCAFYTKFHCKKIGPGYVFATLTKEKTYCLI